MLHESFFRTYRVHQKKFTVGTGLLMQKVFNAFNKILEFRVA